jgi:hypothetical protein
MKKFDLIIQATVFVILVGLFFYLPPLGIWSNDEAVKYIQMKNFHLHGTVAIDYPGTGLGLDLSDLKAGMLLMVEKKQSVFVIFPPLFAWLSSLFYPVMGDRVIHFLPLLAFFFSFDLLNRTLQMLLNRRDGRYALLFSFLLASPALIFAMTFFEHIPALFLVISSLYFLVRYFMKETSPAFLFLSTLLLTSGIFFRTEIFFLAAASGLVLGYSLLKIDKQKEFFIAAIGYAVPVAAYALANVITYGTPLGLHMDFNLRTHQYSIPFALLALFVFGGAAVAISPLEKIKIKHNASFPVRSFMLLVVFAFLVPYYDQSPVLFLFVQFPLALFLFFGISGPANAAPADPREILRAVVIGSSLLFIAFVVFFMRDLHPNVRFALPLIPMILIAIALEWDRICKAPVILILFAVLALFPVKSLIFSIENDLLHFKAYNMNRVDWLTKRTGEGDVIIFAGKPLMHHAGPLFFNRVFVVESRPEKLQQFFDLLKSKGVSRCFFMTSHNGYTDILKAYSPALSVETLPQDPERGNSFSASLRLYQIPLVPE